jgi:hypothetical protein
LETGAGEFGRLYDKTSCASPPPENKSRIFNEGQEYPRKEIDRNCDVLPIVEYSIETDDGQTLN